MTTLEGLGKRIRERREARGLKQADIANALQISAQAVSKWERGENAPDIALLADISRLLGVSVDWLLGLYDSGADVFEATVFVSGVKGYAKKAAEASPRDLAAWANALYYRLTEAVLRHDGVPVKQVGDGLLAFFSGPLHKERAVRAALGAAKTSEDKLSVALCAGEIYLGSIGHPDYAETDILGDTVNIAFRTLELSSAYTGGVIIASASTVEGIEEKVELNGPFEKELSFIPEPVVLYEVSQ